MILATADTRIRMPAYRLHKASGRAVIQFRPLWGKNPIYLAGKFGSRESLADYERRCKQVLSYKVGRQKKTVRKSKRTVNVQEFVLRFMNWAQEHYGSYKHKEARHFAAALRPLVKRYSELPIRSIGPLKAKRVRREMVALGWSRKYVNAQFRRLRAAFAWGVENELASPLQLAALRSIRGLTKGRTTAPEYAPIQPAEWSDVEKLLPFLSPTVATMVELQFLTGMRSAELTVIRDIDVERRKDVWLYRPQTHKNAHRDRPKVICIGPRGQQILAPYLATGDEYAFNPLRAMKEKFAKQAAGAKNKRYGKKKESRFKPSRYRPRYTSDKYCQAITHGFQKALRQRRAAALTAGDDPAKVVGLPHFHPHQLRHTRSTLTRERFGLEGTESQTGNSTPMAERYAERNLPLAIRVAKETG